MRYWSDPVSIFPYAEANAEASFWLRKILCSIISFFLWSVMYYAGNAPPLSLSGSHLLALHRSYSYIVLSNESTPTTTSMPLHRQYVLTAHSVALSLMHHCTRTCNHSDPDSLNRGFLCSVMPGCCAYASVCF